MPMSDVFIATRYQNDSIKWQLFDAYKLNDAYDIEMTENGVIEAITNSDDLIVTGANFSSTRRQNLKGVNITCGLVVFLFSFFLVEFYAFHQVLVYSQDNASGTFDQF